MTNVKYRLEQEMMDSILEAADLIFRSFPESGPLTEAEHLAFWDAFFRLTHSLNRQLVQADALDNDPLEVCCQQGSQQFQKNDFHTAFASWLDAIRHILGSRLTLKNGFDDRFAMLMDRAKYVSYEMLVSQTISKIHALPMDLQASLCLYYQGFSHFWGTMDIPKDCFEVVENRIHALKEHADDFMWLYQRLGDYRSKAVLIYFLQYWLNYDPYILFDTRETFYSDYFDLDLYQPTEDEVFVDLGSFTGDTIQDYIRTFSFYKRFYCFEMAPENMKTLQENLKDYHDIRYISKAVGAEKGSLTVYLKDGVDSANSIQLKDGMETTVEVTTIDEEIEESVSTIKMDIEGAEKDALKGCVRHITNDHPKLLISVYHNNEDIWKIPRMIDEMVPDYRLFLRNNGRQWGPSEIVLIALPSESR